MDTVLDSYNRLTHLDTKTHGHSDRCKDMQRPTEMRLHMLTHDIDEHSLWPLGNRGCY